MDLLEYQGKQLSGRHGLAVSDGKAVTTVEDAVAAANEIGYPVVVKAQVLTGGRGKAGGVKLAATPAEAEERAGQILGMDIKGQVVQQVWIEPAADIARKYYLGVALDRGSECLVMMLGRGRHGYRGGGASAPDKITRSQSTRDRSAASPGATARLRQRAGRGVDQRDRRHRQGAVRGAVSERAMRRWSRSTRWR